jgi:hypothetical protein
LRTPLAIELELNELRGDQLLIALRRFGLSVRLFLANDQKLAELIASLVENRWALDNLFDTKMEPVRTLVLEEITRRLHNYVAAALSLVDHTRHHPAIAEGSALEGSVREEIRSRFLSNPVVQVINGLRNFAVHYSLPPVVYGERHRPGIPTERSLVLRRAHLLSWSGWKALAKRYLDEGLDEIDLDQIRGEYSNSIVEFQHWLAQQLPDKATGLLVKQDALVHELRTALSADYHKTVDVLLRLVSQGIGTIEDPLRFLLRTDQVRGLRERGESIEAFIILIDREYPGMPQDIRDRLRQLLLTLHIAEQE